MSRPPQSQTFSIEGSSGRLECILESPASAALIAVAVVCHPHPVHGGTMQNKVVHTLSRAFSAQQMSALRFNLRGVGESEGVFDDGEGELDDVLSAVDFMRAQNPGSPIWLAGFSFGAAMAIRAADILDVAGLVSIAPAAFRFFDTKPVQPNCPWLIVHGKNDELADINETIEWVNSMRPGPELRIFPDTTHFFHGKLVDLREVVKTFIDKNQRGKL